MFQLTNMVLQGAIVNFHKCHTVMVPMHRRRRLGGCKKLAPLLEINSGKSEIIGALNPIFSLL